MRTRRIQNIFLYFKRGFTHFVLFYLNFILQGFIYSASLEELNAHNDQHVVSIKINISGHFRTEKQIIMKVPHRKIPTKIISII